MNSNKSIVMNTLLPENYRAFACYCLLVDPVEFNDISLLGLERLALIINISMRVLEHKLPNDEEIIRKSCYMLYSFRILINEIFPLYRLDFPNSDSIGVTNEQDNFSLTVNAQDFSELSQMVLLQNMFDYSNINIPIEIYEEVENIVKTTIQEYQTKQ